MVIMCRVTCVKIFLGIAADLGLTVFKVDTTYAYAHSQFPNDTYLAIDDVYADLYKDTTDKDINQRHVLPVYHYLQGHPESGKC